MEVLHPVPYPDDVIVGGVKVWPSGLALVYLILYCDVDVSELRRCGDKGMFSEYWCESSDPQLSVRLMPS